MVVSGLTNFPDALHVIVAVVDVSVRVAVFGLGYVLTISDKSRVISMFALDMLHSLPPRY